MKVETKLVLPMINKVWQEWRRDFDPRVVSRSSYSEFRHIMQSQYGIFLVIKGGPGFPVVHNVDIVDEKKYTLFLLRWS